MNTQTQNNDHPNLNNTQTLDNAKTNPSRKSPLPLPKGEGRGEGEGNLRKSNAHGTSSSPDQPSKTPPASLRVPVRVGKIARLLPSIRNELNQRLENGETADTLLPWLNRLRETKQVLREQFSDQPINKQNLSDWRHGGFAEWQLRQQIEDDASAIHLHAGDLEDRPRHCMADELVTAFTARYASFLIRWDGEVTPQVEAKIKLYSRLRRDLTGLQQSAHWSAKRNEEWDQLEQKKDRQLDAQEKMEELTPFFVELNRAMAEKTGGKFGKMMADLQNSFTYHTPFPFPDNLLPDDDEADNTPKSEPPVAPKNSRPAPASAPQPSTPKPSTNSGQAPSSQLSSTPTTPTISKTQNHQNQQNPPPKTPANPPAGGASLPVSPNQPTQTKSTALSKDIL